MNEMQVFKYEDNEVRTVERNGEVWWVLKDVCDALKISKHRDLAAKLDQDERASIKMDTLGGPQNVTIINEPGLYNAIFHSNKPDAKCFKRWVTHEVLPTIRRTGGYGSQAAILGAMERMMTSFTAAMDSILMRLERLENRQSINDRAWAANYHPGPRKETVVRLPKSSGTLRMETFPPEVLSAVNDMMEQMVEEQTLNFSEIARYCTGVGCFISSPSVRRYYDKHYNQH